MLWVKIVGWVALVLGAVGILQSIVGSWRMYKAMTDPEPHVSHNATKQLKNTWLVTVLLLALGWVMLFLK